MGEFELRVQRLFGSRGYVEIDYSALWDSGPIAVEPGTLRWEDGDQTDRFITVQVLDDDQIAPESEFTRGFMRFEFPRSDYNAWRFDLRC